MVSLPLSKIQTLKSRKSTRELKIMVRTVLDDIDEGNLGITYAHDHLIVRETNYTSLEKRILLDDIDKTETEVMDFKQLGGNSIVDVQPFGAGRDVEALKKISEDTGINIIAATGLHKMEFYKDGFWSENADNNKIADLFIDEIQNGAYSFDFNDPFIRKTSIKTGIIKIATDENGLTDYYRKIFKAAAIASKETGASIITHTELSKFGIEQAEYLLKSGIEPEKIIISHMDKKINLDNIITLAKIGVFLEFDSIARYKYHSDEEEVKLIIEMLENGFEDKLLLGMDSTRERFLSYGGEFGLGYIIGKFIPMLKKAGVKEEQIRKMLINNPKRALRFNL